MKWLLAAVTIALASSVTHAGSTARKIPLGPGLDQLEHGGGCRKSSPPGQCCHMDNKAGSVHCH